MIQERQNNALATVPNSLKAQLDRAQNLLAQSEAAEAGGDRSLAVVKAREGMRVLRALATSSPDHATLLVAGEMGARGFEIEILERIDNYELVEHKFFGITVGHDVVHLPRSTHRTIRGRLL